MCFKMHMLTPYVSKDYGGEPIIDGQVVPYHPKHHDLYHRAQESIRQGMIEEGIHGFPALEAYQRQLKEYYANERKKIKDRNKPKRPPGAFFLFMEDFRKQLKQQNPNVKGVAAMGKAGGERWRSMTCDDKAPYLFKAEQMKMDYQKKSKSMRTVIFCCVFCLVSYCAEQHGWENNCNLNLYLGWRN